VANILEKNNVLEGVGGWEVGVECCEVEEGVRSGCGYQEVGCG